jgi:hypothetical protein
MSRPPSHPAGWSWVAAALLLTSAGLHFWRLADTRPGLYRDEAIAGYQALAMVRHETLPDQFWAPWTRWPLWNTIQAAFVAVQGPTILAIRLPAALAGLLAPVLAFTLLIALFEPWPALAGAGLVGLGFWPVWYGRIAVPHILVVVQGLALLAIMTGPIRRPVAGGVAAGVVAGSAFYSYYAAIHLPLALVAAVVVRSVHDPGFRRHAARFSAAAAGALALTGGLAVVYLRTIRELPTGYHIHAPASAIVNLGRYLAALILPGTPDPGVGFWSIYPPGTALLTPPEAILCLIGLVAWIAFPARRWLLGLGALWLLTSLVPAAVTDAHLRTSRPIGALVPLVLFAAAAGELLMRRSTRWAPAVITAWLLTIAACTGFRLTQWRADPVAALWADSVDTTAALNLKARATRSPLLMAGPVEYSTNPHLAFLLAHEISAGRIVHVPAGPEPHPELIEVIREPVHEQPALFLFRMSSIRRSGWDALGLVNPDGLFAAGDAALASGRPRVAADHYRGVVALVPDFALARLRLADALHAMGDRTGEGRERMIAANLSAGRPATSTTP